MSEIDFKKSDGTTAKIEVPDSSFTAYEQLILKTLRLIEENTRK